MLFISEDAAVAKQIQACHKVNVKFKANQQGNKTLLQTVILYVTAKLYWLQSKSHRQKSNKGSSSYLDMMLSIRDMLIKSISSLYRYSIKTDAFISEARASRVCLLFRALERGKARARVWNKR